MGLFERLETALKVNPNLVTHVSEVEKAEGFSLEQLEGLGLTKPDMLRLERAGLALRAYLPLKTGWRKRYVIINHGEVNDKEAVHGNGEPGTSEVNQDNRSQE